MALGIKEKHKFGFYNNLRLRIFQVRDGNQVKYVFIFIIYMLNEIKKLIVWHDKKVTECDRDLG